MTEPASKRIQKELEAIGNDPVPGCTLFPFISDIFRWNVEIRGPHGSPFEGGSYTLLVTFPWSYPISPPRVRFVTRIFHPNIDQAGVIYFLSIFSSQWAPGISMAQVLQSIIALLSDPNPSYLVNYEATMMLRHDPDNYNRMVRDMVATQRGERTTRRVPSVKSLFKSLFKRRRVGLGSASRIMASRAGEIEEQGEDVAEGINNGDESGVGEDDERELLVKEWLRTWWMNHEEGGAVEQSVGRLKSRMEVVHALQGIHQQFETVTKENGRLEERLRQVEEENRALQDKLAALETKNAEVAEKKPITKTESNSRSDCCKEACASLRALVESFKEERAQMLLHRLDQEELVRQNDLRASMGQAHKEDEGEHLAQEGDDGEALAREGTGEENVVQEGAGGEDFAHGGDGEEDLEEDGADDVAEVGGEDDAQAQYGEEDLAQEGFE